MRTRRKSRVADVARRRRRDGGAQMRRSQCRGSAAGRAGRRPPPLRRSSIDSGSSRITASGGARRWPRAPGAVARHRSRSAGRAPRIARSNSSNVPRSRASMSDADRPSVSGRTRSRRARSRRAAARPGSGRPSRCARQSATTAGLRGRPPTAHARPRAPVEVRDDAAEQARQGALAAARWSADEMQFAGRRRGRTGRRAGPPRIPEGGAARRAGRWTRSRFWFVPPWCPLRSKQPSRRPPVDESTGCPPSSRGRSQSPTKTSTSWARPRRCAPGRAGRSRVPAGRAAGRARRGPAGHRQFQEAAGVAAGGEADAGQGTDDPVTGPAELPSASPRAPPGTRLGLVTTSPLARHRRQPRHRQARRPNQAEPGVGPVALRRRHSRSDR